ncbi:MAG: transcriptional regulator, BadM/Rrf2 family [Desulfomicrobiaceae bacterium]|nr:transcriptional regulator, BadM/Rrf2 family [Desulfomicrobiaceae bacterium]
MRISTTTHYASRLLVELALHSQEKPISASKLAAKTGIPLKFLEKIVRNLKSAGLVKSVRGAFGGHYLGCRPDDITLGALVRLMEGGIRLAQCAPGEERCATCHGCRAQTVWHSITQSLERELDSVTLADMLEGYPPECWQRPEYAHKQIPHS